MKSQREQKRPAEVPKAKQAGEARNERWSWVEASVWTERMLEALEKGVKGGVWFSLIDKVYRKKTLEQAFGRVRKAGGAAGSDHQSIKQFEAGLEAKLHTQLKEGTYRPRPVRRVYIAKPGSRGKRPLGIPAVRDRVVQSALKMVIEPIFEIGFASNSYGFRPQLGCKDALREVDNLLKTGNTWVVDADLKSFFDTIDHDRLISLIKEKIADSRVLDLIEKFLKQEVMEPMKLWKPETGTPQGAVISPLLANIYLHPLDMAMRAAGYKMVRYADDFVIFSRHRNQAQRALSDLGKITDGLKVQLHPGKTHLVNARSQSKGFEFLGYYFKAGKRWPRKKSLKSYKDKIRAKTRRSNAHSMQVIVSEVSRINRGWFEYYKHSRKPVFVALDGWIRRRMRSILHRRRKQKGMSSLLDNRRWPNKYFADLGYFSLADAHRSELQSSRG